MAEKFFGLTESVDNGVSPVYFKTFIAKLSQALNSRNQTADLIADALEFMYTSWPDNSDKYALRIQLVSLVSDKEYFAPSLRSAIFIVEFLRFTCTSSLVAQKLYWQLNGWVCLMLPM
ncbi:Neuroligin-4 [Porites harrisoni]